MYGLIGTISFPVHFLFPENESGQLYGDALSKFIAFVFFLFILWKFQWISFSGINRLGTPRIWIFFLIAVLYKIPLTLYAFSGSLEIVFPVVWK